MWILRTHTIYTLVESVSGSMMGLSLWYAPLSLVLLAVCGTLGKQPSLKGMVRVEGRRYSLGTDAADGRDGEGPARQVCSSDITSLIDASDRHSLLLLVGHR